MYNKKKNKKFKRILALVGVVVIILSALVIPSGAWEVADIPFYNYFDCSKFGTTSEIGDRTDTAQIVSVNPETGFINMYAKFDDSRTFCCVPYSDINLKLSEVCPDLVLGETYVLSGEFYYDIEDGGEDYSIRNAKIRLVREDGSIEDWSISQSLEITPDRLNSYVTLCAGRSRYPLDRPISCGFRYWINKDNAAPFEPYDMFKNIKNEAYEQGKNEGYNAGLAEGTEKGYDEGYNAGLAEGTSNCMFSEEYHYSSTFGFYGSGLGWKYVTYKEEVPYAFSGMSYSLNSFDSSCYMRPVDGMELDTVSTLFDYRNSDQEFMFGSVAMILMAKGCRVEIRMNTSSNSREPIVVVDARNAPVVVDITEAFKSLHMIGSKIDLIEISVKTYHGTDPEAYDPNNYALLNMGDSGSVDYELGHTVGYEKGTIEGNKIGYNQGYEEGLNAGSNDGYKKGYEVGEEEGYNTGYYKGRADEAQNNSFYSLISTVVDVPVTAFRSLFNFEIMGVNMSAFALSLITVGVILVVVKKVI